MFDNFLPPSSFISTFVYNFTRDPRIFLNLQSTSVFDMLMPIFGQFDVIDNSRSITIKIQGFWFFESIDKIFCSDSEILKICKQQLTFLNNVVRFLKPQHLIEDRFYQTIKYPRSYLVFTKKKIHFEFYPNHFFSRLSVSLFAVVKIAVFSHRSFWENVKN